MVNFLAVAHFLWVYWLLGGCPSCEEHVCWFCYPKAPCGCLGVNTFGQGPIALYVDFGVGCSFCCLTPTAPAGAEGLGDVELGGAGRGGDDVKAGSG